jgi:type IV secretory pathway TrbL component
MMAARLMIMAGASLIALAGGATALAQARGGGAGPAIYWMSADTASGMAAMAAGMGQGGRPSAGAVMGQMFGGGGRGGRSSYVHNLTLQLGSPRRAAGAPRPSISRPPASRPAQACLC